MPVRRSLHYGGAIVRPLGAAAVAQLVRRLNRIVTAVTSGAGAVVQLEDARLYPRSAHPVTHYVFNDGSSSDSLLLKDKAGTTLETIPVGQMVRVALQERETQAGVWGVTPPAAFTAGDAF